MPVEFFKIDDYVLHLDPNVGPLAPKWKPRWHKCQIAGFGPYGTYVLKNLDGSLLIRDSLPAHLRKFRQRGSTKKSYEFVTITNHMLTDGVEECDAVGSDYLYSVQWSNGITSWEPAIQFDDQTAISLYWKRRRDVIPPSDFMCPARGRTQKGKSKIKPQDNSVVKKSQNIQSSKLKTDLESVVQKSQNSESDLLPTPVIVSDDPSDLDTVEETQSRLSEKVMDGPVVVQQSQLDQAPQTETLVAGPWQKLPRLRLISKKHNLSSNMVGGSVTQPSPSSEH